MSSTSEFKKAYKELNVKQKEAVDAIYGPVMVIAGPGTGKTQILAVRIANILDKSVGAKPDEIVALTFTESATASLLKRLVSLIGASAYRVRIMTFHGFARSILDKRPDVFPRVSYGTQLSEVSGIALMERLLDAGTYTKIKTPKNPYRTAKDLYAFMGELKCEYYTPESYRAECTALLTEVLDNKERFNIKGKYAGQEKGEYLRKREKLEKYIEVADIFHAYEATLEKEQLYDYQDLIGEAIKGLERDEGLRFEVGEQSQFVLADEHQDANPAQNRLLELVTDFDGIPNLFIVGDEKQAIYRFQGATLASFFYFKEKYPDAKVITLTKNYRSSTEILDTAHDLIAPAPVPNFLTRIKLESYVGRRGLSVRLSSCGTPQEEQQIILSYLKKLSIEGVSYEDIAIITRKNADVLSLSNLLRSAGIPEDSASSDINALSNPAIQVFLSLIRFCIDTRSDNDLARALFLPGIPQTIAERMQVLSLSRGGASLSEVILKQATTELSSWLRTIIHIASEVHTTQAIPWISRLASSSQFLAGVLSQAESIDSYESYTGFMEEVALVTKQNPRATAVDILSHIERIETHGLSVKRARTKRSGVQIMTAHKSKGMEFPYVILAHATDEKWMRGRNAEFAVFEGPEEDEHDERRLFYVALTRAKYEVLITYARENEEARVRTPLRFLADIEKHLDGSLQELVSVPVTKYESRPVLDKEFLRERLLSQGFSPTGFNNYVRSPWQYFFRTLLRIPEQPGPAMLYGTAIHAGLRQYVDDITTRKESIQSAIDAFTRELERLPISQKDLSSLIQQGTKSINAYIDVHGANAAQMQICKTELPISVPFRVEGVGEIILSGKLDRLDVLADGSVTVVDYKTGSAKSENEIRGLTSTSNGDYYRQLVFYKLLLTRDGRYTMNKGALHFVEPDEKGKCVIREFIISDEEVHSLEQELTDAAKAIADGSVFEKGVERDECDYFDLWKLLNSNNGSTHNSIV
jgi:DNA helicase II / ATP-dependent DNA helicase PcrA